MAFWGGGVFRRTQGWLTNPTPVDILGILAMLFGTLFTFALTALRHRFVWWPLYPVGYGITGTWAVNFFWSSVLVVWVIKWCVLRFGGLRTFRRLAPFFLGMLFGEFSTRRCMGADWCDCTETDVSVYLVRAKTSINFSLIRYHLPVGCSTDSASRP